jgi:DDE superfamily endonuclease/Single-strand binding protein family
MQRLLSGSGWDADGVRDDLRDYVVEHLGNPDAVLVLDETGVVKKGDRSAGVQRQYTGTVGKQENCQVGVFLAYATAGGVALVDRDLYLPRSWTDDQGRCRVAGVPDEVGFQTKPQLGQAMLERALAAGVPFGWVTGDTVYGGDRRLRVWLEEHAIRHVMAVKCTEPVWAMTDRGPGQVAAQDLIAQVPAERWLRINAGDGSKGKRFYDWTRVPLWRWGWPANVGFWLLARRSLSDPGDGDTSFFKVNVWRGQAENLADSLAKGDRVMVTGRLRQRSWETAEGEKRSVTELEADEVGASLKWATAKVERAPSRGNGDRVQGRERQAERGSDFNDAPPF